MCDKLNHTTLETAASMMSHSSQKIKFRKVLFQLHRSLYQSRKCNTFPAHQASAMKNQYRNPKGGKKQTEK